MIYNVLTSDAAKSPLIPVADGDYYTESLVVLDNFIEYNYGDFALIFFDADGVTPITPTGGTIKPTMALTEGLYMEPGNGDVVIEATTCIVEADGLATFNLPTFVGGAKRGKITLLGITGATYVKAEFRRYK